MQKRSASPTFLGFSQTAWLSAAALLGAAAYTNYRLAKKAERDNPPSGRFLEVNGVWLHYIEQGNGDPVILLHGNGSMVQDFTSSGLIDMAAGRHRVIAFDRPGYGHSSRPRTTIWTDEAQADLIQAALAQMGIPRATIFGHSWGCSVAVALALKHPERVSALVLASGFYYPHVRTDVVMMSGPAFPILGDVARYVASPLIARAMWPLFLRKIFGPAPVPLKFEAFPKEMAVRPSQIRAGSAEAALMIPDALARAGRYAELAMPVVIIAGQEDALIDIDEQSARLHAELSHSTFHRIPNAGHMVHQTATDQVMAALDEAVELATNESASLER